MVKFARRWWSAGIVVSVKVVNGVENLGPEPDVVKKLRTSGEVVLLRVLYLCACDGMVCNLKNIPEVEICL